MINERGRSIANILPQVQNQRASVRLECLEKRGLIKIGKGGLPDDFWSINRPLDAEAVGSAVLLQERNGGL